MGNGIRFLKSTARFNGHDTGIKLGYCAAAGYGSPADGAGVVHVIADAGDGKLALTMPVKEARRFRHQLGVAIRQAEQEAQAEANRAEAALVEQVAPQPAEKAEEIASAPEQAAAPESTRVSVRDDGAWVIA